VRSELKELEDPDKDENQTAVHRVQPIHGSESLIIVLNKKLTSKLHIRKGDYLKCYISGGKLVMERLNL